MKVPSLTSLVTLWVLSYWIGYVATQYDPSAVRWLRILQGGNIAFVVAILLWIVIRDATKGTR